MSSRMKIALCVLRNDLRYHDNEVLHLAHNNADKVVPLYCFDPRHYEETYHHKFPKTGPHRLKFLLETVANLRKNLRTHGSDLVILHGKPEDLIPKFIKEIENDKDKVNACILQQEVTEEEVTVENKIEACLFKRVELRKIWGATLVHKDDLPFHVKQLPDVYTQFRKSVESQSKIRPVSSMPDQLKPLPDNIDPGYLPSFEHFGLKEALSDERTAFPFSGGESTALERLDYYLWKSNKVTQYKQTRNGLIGHEFSTKLSAWLANGSISPRQIYWQIKKYEIDRTQNDSTYWVIFELLWRDYFRFVALKYGNKLFYSTGLLDKHVNWKKNSDHFEAWKNGETGVPFVDANMRELLRTGFMSNRGRQNVASFLTKDLQLDWRLGAEWFESMLTDYDVCSNYGNWLYSAGIGNDPRENRKFNMIKQGLDYDPDGNYIRLWVPELDGVKDGSVHTVWTGSPGFLSAKNIQLGKTYPYPIVVAPEWDRHSHRSARGGRRGGSSARSRGQSRGIDFYFKSSQHKH